MAGTCGTVRRRQGVARNPLTLFGAVLFLSWGCAQAEPSSSAKDTTEVPQTKSPGTNPSEPKPPAVPPPKAESSEPTPPVLPPSDRRTCKQDTDCELLESRPCSCPPCGDVWREAFNTKTAEDLRQRWAVRRCVQPECPECTGRYLGTRAVCVDGQCAVR